MPDLERLNGIAALAATISRLPTGNKTRPYMGTPAAVLSLWATELYDDLGLRVHPELASHELVRVEPKLGNHSPVQKVTKGTPARTGGDNPEVKRMQAAHVLLMEWLQEYKPDLAQRIAEAQEAQARGNAMEAARVIAEIRRDFPEVWEKGQEFMANMSAENLG